MAKVKETSSSFANELKAVLLQGLKQAGIPAKVEIQRIPSTRLHRVLVVSRQFEHLRHSECQDLVWRIVGEHFKSFEDQLKISMIWTLPPERGGAAMRRDLMTPLTKKRARSA
jgi:hypothetical protein